MNLRFERGCRTASFATFTLFYSKATLVIRPRRTSLPGNPFAFVTRFTGWDQL